MVQVIAVDIDLAGTGFAESHREHQAPTQPVAQLALQDLVRTGVEHLVAQLVLDEQDGQAGRGLLPQVVAVIARRMAFSEQADIRSADLTGNR